MAASGRGQGGRRSPFVNAAESLAPFPALPRITVIVLTWNRRLLLQDCFESLLAQDYPRDRLEILISDDGSADGTREWAELKAATHAGVRYLRQPHRGIAAARNQGIRQATGDFIAIVADDYILPPDYARTIASFFGDEPDAQIMRFHVAAADSNAGSRISHLYYEISLRRRLLPGREPGSPEPGSRWTRFRRQLHHEEEKVTTEHHLEAAGAAAFRSGVFERVGLFDESLRRAEDTDLTLRLRDRGIPIHFFPHLSIRHQYSPLMGDTLKKCFVSGASRYALERKRQQEHGVTRPATPAVAKRELGSVVLALWRARQAGMPLKSLLYLPFMALFEATNKAGFAYAWFIARRSAR